MLVSVLPHAWLVEEVGGERVAVAALVTPGQSPATYQPSDMQATEARRARVYFRTGVPFERGKWLTALEGSAENLRIADLRDGIELREIGGGHDDGHDHGPEGMDPHIWLDPDLLAVQAGTVARVLTEVDPAGAEHYRARRKALLERLAGAKEEIASILSPLRGKPVHVFHPAWGYLLAPYGIEQVPIEIEGKDPSDSELTALVRRARDENIRVVFVQPQITGRAAGRVAEVIGARTVTIDPLAGDVLENIVRTARAISESMP